MNRLIGLVSVFGLSTFSMGLYAQEVKAEPRRVQVGPFTFEFASVPQGREALGQQDEFVRQLSVFDRQVRLQASEDPGEQAFLEFVSAEVIDWDRESLQKYQTAIESLAEPMKTIPLPSPGPILLIRTTGKEESGAAYTRGKVIVLPVGHGAPKDKLIAHELFHVLSRNYPELRDKLYARIGFRRSDPIRLPEALADRKVTNPDAPENQHVIDVKLSEGKTATVTPVLFANREYDGDAKMTIFSNLEVRLMEVDSMNGKQHVAKLKDGEPVMHPLGTPDYLRQVGRNSRSIFHPEEVLADNFSTYLVDRGQAPDKWVIDAMVEELRSFGANQRKR